MARHAEDADDLITQIGRFVRSLKREGLSPNTISNYEIGLRELAGFLTARGYPADVRRVEARHVEEWILDLQGQERPAMSHNRFRSAQRFFRWYTVNHQSFSSPMGGMRAPRLPQYQRVLGTDHQKDLLRACQGEGFEDLRDMALIRVFFATDAPRAQIANLRCSPTDPADRDLDLDRGTVRFSGKGDRKRTVSLDRSTLTALASYLNARGAHPHADLPWLWLGEKGRLTDTSVARALQARGMRAGVAGLYRLNHGLWVVPPGHRRAV